jgi:hypothetical protein
VVPRDRTAKSDAPWYSSARLFRLPISGDWSTVMRRIAEAPSTLSFSARDARPTAETMNSPKRYPLLGNAPSYAQKRP